jgi:hypothetical protein
MIQSNVPSNEYDAQCIVTFEDRRQILNVTERVRDLDHQSVCALPEINRTSSSAVCSLFDRLAMLQEVPTLLRNNAEGDGLAEDLEITVKHFRRSLQNKFNVQEVS